MTRITHLRTVRFTLSLAAMLLLAGQAFGQTTGRIEGRVVLPSGEAAPGSTIEVTSESLLGARIAEADEDGDFRFVALPPGTYKIEATLADFGRIEQEGLEVGLDRTVTVRLELPPTIEDIVVVSADEAPLIDVTSTTTGATFGEELIEELPVARTFQAVAFATPGVTTGAGGQLGSQNPSIGGASVAENRYVVDGQDSTDPAFGISGTSVPFEFIQEVEVKTGGYEAEYGGALGGVLNVITKSGGNELHGDLFGYYNDDGLQSKAKETEQFGQNLGFTTYDIGASVGGKLVQDKLWYFVAVNPSRTDTDYSTRTGRTGTQTNDIDFYAGKLTWQIDPSNQLVFSAFGDPTERDGVAVRNSFGDTGHDFDQGADTFGLTYNGSLTSSLFAEVSAGRFDLTLRQVPYSQAPWYEARSFGSIDFARQQGCGGSLDSIDASNFSRFHFNPGCVGGVFHQQDGDSQRDEARGTLTWFGSTGAVDHEVKLGGTVRSNDHVSIANYPGPAAGPFFDSNGGADTNFDGVTEVGVPVDAGGLAGQRWLLFDAFSLLIEYDQSSAGTTDEQAIYVQDRIRLSDSFSLNLGVRADAFESTGELSGVNQNQELDFGFGDTVAPRAGFTWDVAQNGRSKLYGHFGRFYESVPLDINVRAFGNEQFNFYYFYYPSDGSLPNASNPGTHFYTYRLGGGTRVDPGIEPMYTEESLLGFEYEVAHNVALGVKVTSRELGDVIEDISVDGGQTYFITNPGGSVSANPVTGVPLPGPVTFPEPKRDYQSAELSVNRRFSNNWQLYGSYVYAENEGNYGGLFRQDNGQLDPNITSLYDLPELLIGADGLLPNDRTHQFKVYGSYAWPMRLVTGFYAQHLSGTPISQLGAHPTYGLSERFVTPRGSFGRTPDTWRVDLHLEYPLSLSSGLDLKLVADVFNISDEQEVTAVDQNWTFARLSQTPTPADCGGPGTGPGTSCPAGNPNFGEATAFQAPRTVRLGAKLTW